MPGALAFLERMREAGATPVFISNRREESREYTLTTLRKLGLEPQPNELLLRTGGSSKQSRRERVEQQFAVVALIGDNLADFTEKFDSAGGDYQRRLQAVRGDAGAMGFELVRTAESDVRGLVAGDSGAVGRGVA